MPYSVEAKDDASELARRRQEREAFMARVREGERLAAADPARYRTGLRRMVAFGYAYIALVVVGTLALLVGLVALNLLGNARVPIQFYIPLVLFLFAVARSLAVKVELPKHVVVARAEAPELYRSVDAIADALKAPRPDEIQIDARFNAAAAQYPRFGLFGANRNILILGLPYLFASSPDEMRSVIGHELGHFSGRHGRLGVSIYRIESVWSALYENLRRSGRGDFVFRPFVNWYYPRLSAMSFAIRRQDEYEADASAAEATHAAVAGRALLLGPARYALLTEAFWNGFNRRLAEQGPPKPGFLLPMADAARQPLDTEAGRRATKTALAAVTDYDDTHPSLNDRLRSLGVDPDSVELDALVGPSAAEAFLGRALPEVARRVEAELRKDNEESWTRFYKEQSARRQRRDRLVQTAEEKPLSEKEAIELATVRAGETDDPQTEIEIFRELAAHYPTNDRAACLLGRALLQADDAEGLTLLEGRSKTPELRQLALQALGQYHARHGNRAELDRVRAEAAEYRDRRQMAQEGIRIDLGDELLAPDLSPDQREKLVEQLRELPELGRAYAFRKQLPGTGEIRDYLFVLPRPKLEAKDEASRLVNEVVKKVAFRGRTQIYCLQPRKEWRRRLDAIPDALLYDRKAKP